MSKHRPLALTLLAAIAGVALVASGTAMAQESPPWYESSEPMITPSPAAATPAPQQPMATPTPSGPTFTGFTHSGSSPDEGQGAKVYLYIDGAAPGEKPVTYTWSAPQGTLSAKTGDNVTWEAPVGKPPKPWTVPVTVTVSDGAKTVSGKIMITVNADGDAEVSKLEVPGLSSDPEEYMGCFTAGTPVRMADGSTKPIEAIQVGDRLAAYDEAGQKPADAKVQQVLVHQEHPYALSTLKTEDGHVLTGTADHPIFTADGQWKDLSALKPGDRIFLYQGAGKGFQPVKVQSVVKDAGEAAVVYNLKTSQHDYVAADILVHNKCLAQGSLVEAPGGAIRVEDLKPGMVVYGCVNGRKVPTRVTHLYTKDTVAPTLPGKQLAPGLAVTINHLVHQAGTFRPAGDGAFADVAIAGTVYDVQTEAGNYYCSGYLMTASAEAALAA